MKLTQKQWQKIWRKYRKYIRAWVGHRGPNTLDIQKLIEELVNAELEKIR